MKGTEPMLIDFYFTKYSIHCFLYVFPVLADWSQADLQPSDTYLASPLYTTGTQVRGKLLLISCIFKQISNFIVLITKKSLISMETINYYKDLNSLQGGGMPFNKD